VGRDGWRVGRGGEGVREFREGRGGFRSFGFYPQRCWGGWDRTPLNGLWCGIGAGAAIYGMLNQPFYPPPVYGAPVYSPEVYAPPPGPVYSAPPNAPAPYADPSAQVAQLQQQNQALQQQVAQLSQQLAQVQAQLSKLLAERGQGSA